MIAVIIICAILLLAALLLLMPVGITAEYVKAGLQLAAHAGPVQIKLYPRNQQKSSKPQRPSSRKEKTPKGSVAQRLGGALPLFRELLGLAVEAQAVLRNHLRIRELTICLTVGGREDDPAKTAVSYGRAWGMIGLLWPEIERAFRIENPDISTNVDFTSDETKIYAKVNVTIAVGSLLRMAAHYGLRGLTIYRNHRKKGALEHGTSNQ